ncbi:diaminobutyrate--2-oxoglutarate transaminase [Synoicihabitans lomoniglobus]|uniref:Diaminobutyrate--2-oxoglutarate transaminase n=1 Tax=Synoicihabitans lomoniglobus TaxID=2909285 RepID=A0AAF0CNM1_9BACT|nr:diaminobutyrate--2-oxoglutarate transaminase [Opitutaceae bacterium LMO-M01]WED65703.1 diaminobutyrate--2-oxoglutarate transaminase [Opitutaceae bacterium LMO-M01]
MNIFQRRESEIRSYSRSYPTIFERAEGARLFDREGRPYVDFFAGAGALNYGHNPPAMREALIAYLQEGGVLHSLDMATVAKQRFLERFEEVILEPRGMDYKLQFTAPTGTNAIEAALKLARRVTKRRNVIAFTNAYHGLSAGALAVTANRHFRHEAWTQRLDASFMPFDGYLGAGVDTLAYLRRSLSDTSSGIDLPAAIVLETVQAEGGVNIARTEWLQGVADLCQQHGILLIVDDIQVGCGRTGSFFSFERTGIRPDLIALSKSISGCGLPMSLLLIKPEHDQWKPGEHTGTFRGNNLAFVAATEALNYWATAEFTAQIAARGAHMSARLHALAAELPEIEAKPRGVGMIHGLEFKQASRCQAVASEAFQQGLIIEICGSGKNVLKFLPPLTIDEATLDAGIDIVRSAVLATAKGSPALTTAPSE